MKRAILLGTLAAASMALFCSPSRAESNEPCQQPVVQEAPCLVSPPCPPPQAPCQG